MAAALKVPCSLMSRTALVRWLDGKSFTHHEVEDPEARGRGMSADTVLMQYVELVCRLIRGGNRLAYSSLLSAKFKAQS